MSRSSRLGRRLTAVVLGVLAAGVIGGATAAPAQAQDMEWVWDWCFDWEGGGYGMCWRHL
ncbi:MULTISPECIES: hypothetical protein [Nonomuraea]